MKMSEYESRLAALDEVIRSYRRIMIAFSGGVDSSVLLDRCVSVLGVENVIAATGVSQTYTPEERADAEDLVARLGVTHVVIETDELADPCFASNPKDRCFHCKTELYAKIIKAATDNSCNVIFDATNADDLSDYRPGLKAAREAGVKSPLADSGITKADIREMAAKTLPHIADKPASPCLASRIPYGTHITAQDLLKIAAAERFLRAHGFPTVRVRHHGNLARIEVPADQIAKLCSDEVRETVANRLREIGYSWVSIDIEGFKSGSMNRVI